MKIISLSGKKQSGKSTVALMIRDILLHYDSDLEVFVLYWADALKKEVADGCKITVKYLEDHKENFRLILQGWGTDFKRNLVNQDYWVNKLLVQLLKLPDNCWVIIPDTRFLNEAKMLNELGAQLWKIDRSKEFDGARLVSNKPTHHDSHQSETELDDFVAWNQKIENFGSLGELKGTVLSALQKANLIKL